MVYEPILTSEQTDALTLGNSITLLWFIGFTWSYFCFYMMTDAEINFDRKRLMIAIFIMSTFWFVTWPIMIICAFYNCLSDVVCFFARGPHYIYVEKPNPQTDYESDNRSDTFG